MSWQHLSSLVGELQDMVRRRPMPAAEPRVRAAGLALTCWGDRDPEDMPGALVNVAALALATADRLHLHLVRPAASQLVDATDLHSLPGDPPRAFRSAGRSFREPASLSIF